MEEGADRVTWDSPVQFFFTVLGFCVGLGNIWRFPYLCQKNGGGAFIIPFLVMLLVVGMPLLLLELALGQKLRVGAARAWYKVHPALGGIGYGSTVVAGLVGCYYNVIIAWCIFYLWSSMNITLPWSTCPIGADNVTVVECADSSETQYFWFRTTLDASGSIEDLVGIKYWNFICLVLSWLIIYAILCKGIASSGKVVYFTALFPYFVLTIFFFRGITLHGASKGLAHMFTPKMDKLLLPTVWLDAANQVFYSFGLAFGSIISFGSYNNPAKNCVKDVIIITACNAFTAIYACAVIFSILGFKAVHLFEKCMAHDIAILQEQMTYPEFKDRLLEDIPYEEYTAAMNGFVKDHVHSGLKNCSLEAELDEAAQGTGLAFIVMADVFTKIPGAPIWSCLFFCMLLSLGLGSQIGIMEGVLSTLFDQPSLKNVKKPILVAIIAVFCFCVGTIFTTGAGEYWLTLFDSFGATGLTLIAFLELIAVMYVYGHKRFTDDIENMTGVRPGPYWQIMWRFISPALMSAVIASSIYFLLTNNPKYSAWNKEQAKSEDREYTHTGLVFAAILAIASLVPVAGGAILHVIRRLQNENYYQSSVIHRVDTNASTAPMMANFEEKVGFESEDPTFPKEFHDLPVGADDSDSSDSDSGRRISIEPTMLKKKQPQDFSLEVID